MRQRFIELYLDEDVDVLVADLLRSRGFNAVTTRDAKRLGSTDEDQLVYAVSQRKAFLTHNRIDFERLAREYFTARKNHYGLIIAARRNPHDIVRRLLSLMNHVIAEEMKDQLRYL